jgi:hypothetical protein
MAVFRFCLATVGLALVPLFAQQPPSLQLFFDAASTDVRRAETALRELDRAWENRYTPLIIDLARFLPTTSPQGTDREQLLSVRPDAPEAPVTGGGLAAPASPATMARARLVRFLEKKTGQKFGDDLGRWREWMWKLPAHPHPDYFGFKAAIYGRVDPRMSAFFAPNADGTPGRATIRLDEIDWGGVKVNGIPPLVSPPVVPAARATWLKDSHIVFGVEAGGETRAYPRRILAWQKWPPTPSVASGSPSSTARCAGRLSRTEAWSAVRCARSGPAGCSIAPTS